LLALSTLLVAWITGLDRDRALYPVTLIVVASYYELFAAMGGAATALWLEAGVAAIFVASALIGFPKRPWLIAVGLAAHGIFDLMHPHLIDNAGVPEWWPAFCMAFDVVAAAGVTLKICATRGQPPAAEPGNCRSARPDRSPELHHPDR
jgi:hypothetical protein